MAGMTGNSVTALSRLRSAGGMLSGLRGDGTAWLLLGSLVAGLLAYVFSVAGGRVLGSAAFAPIANLWTLQYVIMAILLFAIEQYEVRAVAASGGDVRALHGAWPVLWAIVIAVALGATMLLFVFADRLLLGQADLALVGGAWVVTAGAFGMVRGIYGGRAEYRLSGIATAADWIARIAFTLLVLVAFASTRNLAWTLPAGAVPFLAWWWLRGRKARPPHTTAAPERSRPGSYLAGLSFANGSLQLLLGIGPLVVVALGESPSAVSAFFVTAALARAPFLIGIGFVPRVLTPLTRMAEAGDYAHVRGLAWLVVAGTVALAAIAGVGAFLLGPPIVSLLYGPAFVLTDVATAGAVAAVIVALGALGLNQVVLAEGRPLALVPAWTFGLIAAAAVVVLVPLEPLPRVAMAMLAGQLVAVVSLAVVVTSRVRR
jgi:O-antigen/teichoic acid export membrane protein